MDVRIEAAPMAAKAEVMEAVITVTVSLIRKALSLIERVASFSCPTLGSHSLSAVAPDAYFKRGHVALGFAA